MQTKGTFHSSKDDKGTYWYVKTETGRGKELILRLHPDDQEDRKNNPEETQAMEGLVVGFRIEKIFLANGTQFYARLNWTEPNYTVDDIIAAVEYGFKFRDESQHKEFVPVGNTLQWLMARKGIMNIPKSWEKFKN